MKRLLKISILFFAILVAIQLPAQKKKAKKTQKTSQAAPASQEAVVKPTTADTSSPKTVTITSAFKPVLPSAAKLNFMAATPVIDSSKIPVVYNIPSQNLFFSYQPVTIKPLALNVDSTLAWENDQYLKFGAGNFSSLLGEAALSFGDGKTSITNIRANFLTATGHLPAQQASKLGIDLASIFSVGEDHELTAHGYYKGSTQYFYGYEPVSLPYTKEELLQRFNTIGIEAGLRNKTANDFGITYHPQINLIRFYDNRGNTENDLMVKAPINKVFSKFYSFDLGLMADVSTTNISLIPSPLSMNNNLFYVHPAFQFTTPNVKLHLGIQPTWDNQSFTAFPELTIETKFTDMDWSLEAGWTGNYQKNTYRSLAEYNPWISAPTSLLNTKIAEQYIGIKGSSGNHLTYMARLSFLKLNNQPLFVNDQTDGKTFQVLYEPGMNAVRLHAEAAYTVAENLSFLASTSYTSYNNFTVNTKAWGLLPFEMTGTLKWKLRKDLQIKADAYIWDGSDYRDKTLQPAKSDPVADINLGAEFTVMPRLNLWLQMNNMLNNAYQRWNQYPVLGFTVLGGVVYSFR